MVLGCKHTSKSNVVISDLYIKQEGFIYDSVYLKEILYPFTLTGEPTQYNLLVGKYLKIRIRNNSNKTIYFYSASHIDYPIDTLVNKEIEIDSFLIADKYVAVASHGVRDNFEGFNDSLSSGSEKVRLIFLKEKYKKIKGVIGYGIKNEAGDFVFKEQNFLLNIFSFPD